MRRTETRRGWAVMESVSAAIGGLVSPDIPTHFFLSVAEDDDTGMAEKNLYDDRRQSAMAAATSLLAQIAGGN